MIEGSGVDLEKFNVSGVDKQDLLVVLPARMLRDKGVVEFVEAAKLLTKEFEGARFILVGDIDLDNPSSLTIDEIGSWVKAGYVEHWGYQADMAGIYAQSAIVVLPSYREGFPKVLLEAAACGRPVVTTDVPGCRDAVISDETGFLVPSRNPEKLAGAIAKLLRSKPLREIMGTKARALAERSFDVKKVIDKHINIYESVVSKSKQKMEQI